MCIRDRKVSAVDSTFQKVSENFKTVFERLVPRGTAKLVIHRRNEDSIDQANDVDVDMDTGNNEDTINKEGETVYTLSLIHI